MKNLFQISLLFLTLSISMYGQGNSQTNDFKIFSDQVSPQKTVEEIKDTLSVAEETFKANKKQYRDNYENLAKSTLDYALFKKHVFTSLNEKLTGSLIQRDEMIDFFKVYESNAEEMEELFEDSIKIFENDLKVENIQLATAKYELANAKENYKVLRDFSSDWNRRLEVFNRIQTLYLEAFTLLEKLLPKNHDLTMVTALHLANSYSESADFENALNYYDKFIVGISEVYGRKSKNLLSALRVRAAIFKTIGREDRVKDIANHISEITNEKEDFGEAFLLLSPRAKSFKYKGIREIRAKTLNSGPTGVRRGGTDFEAADIDSVNSIGARPETGSPQFSIIFPGSSSIRMANVVKTKITVDTDGTVISAEAEIPDSKLKEKVEKSVRKWRFRPFVFEGKETEMKGIVYYYNL